MIEEIYIRDLGVIQEARLPFKPGLTVLTGETGAGKTMVLSALGLLLGERADTSAIRRGQDQAFVEGRWMLPADSEIAERVREAGADLDQGELILNRSVSSEGRSRAAVSGRAAPIALLSELGNQLVVVHGQSDQIRLKSPLAQREALDKFAGPQLELTMKAYRDNYKLWKVRATELAELRAQLANREREADELRASVTELASAELLPQEDVLLTERAAKLANLEELRLAATSAHESLSSENFGDSLDAIALLGQARRALEQATQHDPELERIAEQVRNIGYQLSDTATELAGYLDGLEADASAELEALQLRLATIGQLMRKYGPSLDEVLAFQESASQRVLELDSSTETIDRLETETLQLQQRLLDQAGEVTQLRRAAAILLAREVSEELSALAMGGAELVVQIDPATELSNHGADTVSILLSAYPGAEPRPLGKGASGGELSRIMLAIEVVLAKTEQTPTFIFDEVDAGVGGAAATEVGRRLAMLAKQAQVIVVTHLAQVAAYANQHLRVLKTSSVDFTGTDVVALDYHGRIEELTRMLSGLTESDSGRAHASELLERAHREFA